MASKSSNAIRAIFKKINKVVGEAASPDTLRPVAEFTIDLIVKRTRLGFGISANFAQKTALASLSPRYIKFRRTFSGLSAETTPGKSNLTLTGDMLDSMRIIALKNGYIRIGPTGTNRRSGKRNSQIAAWQEERGRIFNRISQLEYQQVLRFYRRTFGDLLRKKHLFE